MNIRVDSRQDTRLPAPSEVAKRKGSFWISNLIVLGILSGFMYWLFPRTLSWLVYQILWGHLPYIGVVILGVIICVKAARLFNGNRTRHLGVVYGLLGVFVIAGGLFVQWSGASSVLAQHNAFAPRKALLDDDNSHVRFTPFEVAFRGMKNTFSDSTYYLDGKDMAALDVDGGFGYVVPIVPNGVIQPFLREMSGFVIFNDDPTVPDDKRIRRVHQSFKYGIGMQWFTDIWLQLARHDPFAVYGEPYYEQLDPANRDKFTIVVPKMKYSYSVAAYFVPVAYLDWGGVTLVYDDGKIENLSVAEAKSDPRLKGHMIYPRELAENVINAQVYDEGLLSGWIQRPGKIEVPELPGDNQMPFLIKSADGHSYDVVTAEPAGPSHSVFRVYAIDVSTGDRSVFEFNPEKQGLIGPAAAISYGKAIPGINWVEQHKDGETGNFRLIETIPITRNGSLFWKMTITQRDSASVVGTVIVNPAQPTEGTRKFDHRAEFMAWLNGNDGVPAATLPTGGGSDLQTLIDKARQDLNAAQSSLDALETAIKKK